MKSSIFHLLLFVEVVSSFQVSGIERQFVKFKERYNKTYQNTEEYYRRLDTFASNFKEIEQHNAGNVTWRKWFNEFADMTLEEFNDSYANGYLNTHRPSVPTLLNSLGVSHLPKNKDWRNEGVITAVKNQGSCGSCWAHAGTEQLETYLKLETHSPLLNLSVQQITSCTSNPLQCGGKGGCNGGIAQFAFNYAELVGVVKEEEYPYISGQTMETEECYYNPSNEEAVAFARGQETLPHNDYHTILKHIANVGPLAINVDASGWKSYGAGVYNGCSYSENIDINHVVQLVGYGTDDKEGDYWLVRNSWGSSWGEDGYIRLLREPEVLCGLNETPLDGTGCKLDGIQTQKVCGMCGILFEATYPIGTERTRGEEIRSI